MIPSSATNGAAEPAQVPHRDYVAMVSAAIDIISARLLTLIATIGAVAMWLWAVYDPTTPRTTAATGFSLTVLLPLVLLYWRRSQ